MGDLVATSNQASSTLKVYDKVSDPLQFANDMAEAATAMMGCNPNQGKAIALHCLCSGLSIVDFQRRYHWFQGKPTMRADAMLAEFRMNYGGQYVVLVRNPDKVRIKFTDHEGRAYEVGVAWDGESGMKHARWPWVDWRDHDKGLKDNWATPTDRETMMFARLVSASLRWICPELVAGVYTPEEMGDIATSAAKQPAAPTKSIDQIADEMSGYQPQPEDDAIEGEVIQKSEAGLAPAAEPAPTAEPTGRPDDPAAPGSISSAAQQRLQELFGLVNATPEKIQEWLAARSCSVVRNLSQQQAQEMIDRLQSHLDSLGK